MIEVFTTHRNGGESEEEEEEGDSSIQQSHCVGYFFVMLVRIVFENTAFDFVRTVQHSIIIIFCRITAAAGYDRAYYLISIKDYSEFYT